MSILTVPWSRRLYRRLRPEEGWIPLLLMSVAVGLVAWSVAEARWVPQIDVVYRAGGVALLLTAVLARRSLHGWQAWALILAYGLVLVILWLAKTFSPVLLLLGPAQAAAVVRRDLLLFWVQVLNWARDVAADRPTRETLVFALGVGWLTWILVAYATWAVFRTRRPLQALTVLGIALAVNNYFGGVTIWSALAFIGIAVLLVGLLHYGNLRREWDKGQVDYSDEIQIELAFAATLLAVLLVTVAAVVPAVPYGDLARRFAGSAVVAETEQGLGQALAGVRPPRVGAGDEGGLIGDARPGIFPRSFLIGNAPELAETEMFRARVFGDVPAGLHWRGITVDEYLETGWRISREITVREVPAGSPLDATPPGPRRDVAQEIVWTGANPPRTRYHLGAPRRLNIMAEVLSRAPGDLVRIGGDTRSYTVSSAVSTATPAQLRAVDVVATTPELLARYTQLPDSLPRRVRDLAQEVAGERVTAYDQALALEQFLRQYPYSLEESRLPPAGRDPVDFFLFDLRIGYCDYYASAMVVMARTLGLPARFATGYLQQPPSPAGEQTVMQLNAHAWAEIYFPGYGWVEFEPTAGFSTPGQGPTTPEAPALGDDLELPPLPPVPASFWARIWPGLLLLALLSAIVALAVRRERPWSAAARGVPELWAYAQLQESGLQLDSGPRPAQTPAEFGDALTARIDILTRDESGRRRRGWETRFTELAAGIDDLIRRYARQQYAPTSPADDGAARGQWRRLRGLFWRLRLLRLRHRR